MIATSTSNHNVLFKHSVTNYFLVMVVTPILLFVKYQEYPTEPLDKIPARQAEFELAGKKKLAN